MTFSMIDDNDDNAGDRPTSRDEVAVWGKAEACVVNFAGTGRGWSPPTGLSDADTDTAFTTAGSAPIRLGCPHCGSTECLRTGEGIAVLAEVRFVLGTTEPDHDVLPVLADSQRWPPDSHAIVCGSCDRVDLRYDDLIAAVVHADPTPTGVPVASAQTPGAMS